MKRVCSKLEDKYYGGGVFKRLTKNVVSRFSSLLDDIIKTYNLQILLVQTSMLGF